MAEPPSSTGAGRDHPASDREDGFTIVAVEAYWPDAVIMDRWVRDLPLQKAIESPFQRFPTWMWRNADVAEFLAWVRQHNALSRSPAGAPAHQGGHASASTSARQSAHAGYFPVRAVNGQWNAEKSPLRQTLVSQS